MGNEIISLFIATLFIARDISYDAPLGSSIDSKCESEMKTAEEQGVGAHSLARSTLRGRRACWSSGMGLGRMTST
jgi:hypothetical protein